MGTPSQPLLKRNLQYEPKTGELRWRFVDDPQTHGERIRNTRHAGKLAGTLSKRSGIVVHIDGAFYAAHRLAWKMMTGSDVPYIKHLNGDLADNRWDNLRETSRLEINRLAFEARAREFAKLNLPDDPGDHP